MRSHLQIDVHREYRVEYEEFVSAGVISRQMGKMFHFLNRDATVIEGGNVAWRFRFPGSL